jgi:hypothetical protein
MKKELTEAIKALADKAGKSDKAIDAQQYAQAVLNLSNALVGQEINKVS